MSDPSNPFKSLADSLSPAQSQSKRSLCPKAVLLIRPSHSVNVSKHSSPPSSFTARLQELASIGALADAEAADFIWAAAEEDPDPLIRIAAIVQLLRREASQELEPLIAILKEETENPRVYSLGLLLIEELPEPLLEKTINELEDTIPDEAVNCAALIQLIREAHPERLLPLLERCIDRLEGDLELLDEEVWDELILSLTVEEKTLQAVKSRVEAYISELADDHPRRFDFT